MTTPTTPTPCTGNLTFENLDLKQTPIDGVPLQILGGKIGKLTIQVPWDSLKTKSTVVLIQRVQVEIGALPLQPLPLPLLPPLPRVYQANAISHPRVSGITLSPPERGGQI